MTRQCRFCGCYGRHTFRCALHSPGKKARKNVPKIPMKRVLVANQAGVVPFLMTQEHAVLLGLDLPAFESVALFTVGSREQADELIRQLENARDTAFPR